MCFLFSMELPHEFPDSPSFCPYSSASFPDYCYAEPHTCKTPSLKTNCMEICCPSVLLTWTPPTRSHKTRPKSAPLRSSTCSLFSFISGGESPLFHARDSQSSHWLSYPCPALPSLRETDADEHRYCCPSWQLCSKDLCHKLCPKHPGTSRAVCI